MTSTPFMTSVRFVKLALLAPLALTVAACSGPAEQQFVQADANNIRQRTQEFETAFNAKDAGKVAKFYPGEGVLMPPNAPTIRGREEIQKFYVDLYSQGGTDLQMDTKDVRGHGTLAYETGTYSLNRRPEKGAAVRDRGKYMFIWRNTNGQWLMEYTIWSSDLPDKVDIAPSK